MRALSFITVCVWIMFGLAACEKRDAPPAEASSAPSPSAPATPTPPTHAAFDRDHAGADHGEPGDIESPRIVRDDVGAFAIAVVDRHEHRSRQDGQG